jgi:drug/metabolite transporter (DMT)-like permease
MENRSKAFYLALLAAGIAGICLAAPFIRIAQRNGADNIPFTMAFWRLLTATIIVIPIGKPWTLNWRAFFSTLSKPFSPESKPLTLAIISGILLAGHFVLWFQSMSMMPLPQCVVLVTTTPIWTVLAEFLIWKKRLTALTLVGIIIAFSGSTFIALSVGLGESTSIAGAILAVVAAMFACAYLLLSKVSQGKLTVWQTVSISYPTATVCLLLGALVSGNMLTGFNHWAWLAMIGMGIFPHFLGHTALNVGVKHLTPAITTTAVLFEPIGASLIAYFFMGEVITWTTIAGGLVVLCGIWLTTKNLGKADVVAIDPQL